MRAAGCINVKSEIAFAVEMFVLWYLAVPEEVIDHFPP